MSWIWFFFANSSVIISHAAPWGKKLPPKFIPNIKAISKGVAGNPAPLINTVIIGINKTVIGTLSNNPDKIEVVTKIKIHIKNKSLIDRLNTRFSNKIIVPFTSIQKTKINKHIKKKTNLKSIFEK